jgi:sugar O-acyltransferase (sialic acid O-acetyltransferase NeuD family)
MPPKIIIWGAGWQARVVADILRLRGEFEVAGFLDDVNPHRKGEAFEGREILGGREILAGLGGLGVTHLIFGFGNSAAKFALAPLVEGAGFTWGLAIHPGAHVPPGTSIGPGTVIKAGAVVDPGVRIGAQAIIGANTVITHGSVLEAGARLAVGSVIGSRVRIGRGALVGLGALVNGGVVIGAGALVGAGAVVVRDVPPGMVAAGNPARILREARADDF